MDVATTCTPQHVASQLQGVSCLKKNKNLKQSEKIELKRDPDPHWIRIRNEDLDPGTLKMRALP